MGGHREARGPVALEIADLGVAHSTELPTEILLPEHRCRQAGIREFPGLEQSAGSAEREQPGPVARVIDHRFVEDVAFGILELGGLPCAAFAVEELQARGARQKLVLAVVALFGHELGQREHDSIRKRVGRGGFGRFRGGSRGSGSLGGCGLFGSGFRGRFLGSTGCESARDQKRQCQCVATGRHGSSVIGFEPRRG